MTSQLMYALAVAFSYVLIILGSAGMIVFARQFPFSSSIWELRNLDKKFLGLTGDRVWYWSWTLIISGTFIQLLDYVIAPV